MPKSVGTAFGALPSWRGGTPVKPGLQVVSRRPRLGKPSSRPIIIRFSAPVSISSTVWTVRSARQISGASWEIADAGGSHKLAL